MKKTLCIALAGLISVQAHAGFWDSLTGSDKKDEQQTTAAVSPSDVAITDESSSMTEAGMALIPMLTQSLGVNETQATGGMGSILQAAQGLLSGNDFSTLTSAIPNAESLLSAAPDVSADREGGGSLLSGAIGAASEYSANTKVGAQLLAQFKSLGLSPSMISKFTDVATRYLQNGEVPESADLLSSALSGIIK